MGEIAEMMLDGTLCEACGCFIDEGEADGFPRYCSAQCAQDRGVEFLPAEPRRRPHKRRSKAQRAASRARHIAEQEARAFGRPFRCTACNRRFETLKAGADHCAPVAHPSVVNDPQR